MPAVLQRRPDVALRFVTAYRQTVDWMYSDPKALELYARKLDRPLDLIKEMVSAFYPKQAMQTDKMSDMPGILRDAVKLKFLRQPLTEAQLAELVRTPPP